MVQRDIDGPIHAHKYGIPPILRRPRSTGWQVPAPQSTSLCAYSAGNQTSLAGPVPALPAPMSTSTSTAFGPQSPRASSPPPSPVVVLGPKDEDECDALNLLAHQSSKTAANPPARHTAHGAHELPSLRTRRRSSARHPGVRQSTSPLRTFVARPLGSRLAHGPRHRLHPSKFGPRFGFGSDSGSGSGRSSLSPTSWRASIQ